MSKITLEEQCKILLTDGKIVSQISTGGGFQWLVDAYGHRYLITKNKAGKYGLSQFGKAVQHE